MYIGIDLGTSAVKVLLVDASGAVKESRSSPLQVSRPDVGWSEQDPESWWDAVDDAMCSLAAAEPSRMAKVRAIGLAGQMHGLVALGAANDPLRPAILWNDTRCAMQASRLDEQVPAFRTIGGNAVMPGFTAPKVVWMGENEPALFNQITTILLPKDYLRLRLTGNKLSDMSDAAGTLWLDVANRCWSDELLAACGLNRDQMPDLVEGNADTGHLLPELRARWGISGVPIVAGGAGDNAAAAIGLGVVSPGDGFVSLGTSGVVFTVTESFAPAADSGAHAFCHAIPDMWHQMGVTLAASDAVSWLCDITGMTVTDLMAAAAETDPRAVTPLFHPYLSGERTPHNNADACGAIFGIRRNHGPADMARAVMQGVAFAIADALDVLRKAGAAPSRLLATGGGAANLQWLHYVASVTDCEIAVPEAAETGAALGAARLAMMADGGDVLYICRQPEIAETILPNPELQRCLTPARARSQAVYQMIAELDANI